MAFNKKTWIEKGKPNATPLNDDALNDLESRIEGGISESEKLEKVDIFIAKQGFTITSQNIHKHGKHFFGEVIVKKENGYFTTTQENILTSSIRFLSTHGFCTVGTENWYFKGIGYLYLNNLDVLVADCVPFANCTHVKIFINAVAQ